MTFSGRQTPGMAVWVAPATSQRLGHRKPCRRRPLLETRQPPRLSIKFASLCVPGYPAGIGNASIRRSIAPKSRRVM